MCFSKLWWWHWKEWCYFTIIIAGNGTAQHPQHFWHTKNTTKSLPNDASSGFNIKHTIIKLIKIVTLHYKLRILDFPTFWRYFAKIDIQCNLWRPSLRDSQPCVNGSQHLANLWKTNQICNFLIYNKNLGIPCGLAANYEKKCWISVKFQLNMRSRKHSTLQHERLFTSNYMAAALSVLYHGIWK